MMTETEKKEYFRTYREAHIEHRREIDRQYYHSRKDDPEFLEKRRVAVRKYRRKHPRNSPDQLKEWAERKAVFYASMSPEEKKEYNHQRYLRRREKALEYSRTHPKKKPKGYE